MEVILKTPNSFKFLWRLTWAKSIGKLREKFHHDKFKTSCIKCLPFCKEMSKNLETLRFLLNVKIATVHTFVHTFVAYMHSEIFKSFRLLEAVKRYILLV